MVFRMALQHYTYITCMILMNILIFLQVVPHVCINYYLYVRYDAIGRI